MVTELRVALPLADAEIVADALAALVADGTAASVALEPAVRTSDERDHAFELLPDGATVRLAFTAPPDRTARRALRRRLSALPLGAPLPRLRYVEVRDDAWADAWREHFDVLHVGERLVVRPSWRDYEPREGEIVFDLDPGRAFGTGQHPTTRLCLEALEREVTPGADVIDVGTGSAVLAIAAAKLGARRVRALDTDPSAIEVARDNARRNAVAAAIDLAAGSLGDGWPWPDPAEASADVVVVNISSAVLGELMPGVAAALRPGGRAILSGFYEDAAPALEAAATGAGLAVRARTVEDGWCCLLLAREEVAR